MNYAFLSCGIFALVATTACMPHNNASNATTEISANVTKNQDIDPIHPTVVHQEFLATLPEPDAVIKTSPALLPGETISLQALISRYVDGHYGITEARFFKVDGAMNWPQMRTSFYSKRSGDRPIKPGGGPAYPAWAPASPPDEPGAYMLIDFYPAQNNQPDFLISMARKPLADGSKLVGYFTVKATEK